MSIGKKIKELRKSKNISQEKLADELGVSQAMIAQYESGKRNPKIETLNRIAKALTVDISSLVEFPYLDKDSKTIYIDTRRKEDYEESLLLTNFRRLNINGKEKAIEHVEMLAKIPEYQRMVTEVFAGNQSVEDLLEEEDSPDQD